jgi:hypothetical protein
MPAQHTSHQTDEHTAYTESLNLQSEHWQFSIAQLRLPKCVAGAAARTAAGAAQQLTLGKLKAAAVASTQQMHYSPR